MNSATISGPSSVTTARRTLAELVTEFHTSGHAARADARLRQDLERLAALSPHLLDDAGFAPGLPARGAVRRHRALGTTIASGDLPAPPPMAGRT